MKHFITALVGLLCACNLSFAQIQDEDRIGWVPDQLYWNGADYLVDHSFLSFFSNYKKLYPDIETWEVFSVSLGMSGSYDGQNYTPIWLLQDSILYLRDITFLQSKSFIEEKLPQKEQYKRMEKLTGQKFRKEAVLKTIQEPKESPLGSLKANWVNGVYLVKKARKEDESIDLWKRLTYQKLTFKDGKVISIERLKPQVKPIENTENKSKKTNN